MAKLHHLPPSAASLTASLRDLGYSLETAIADLIDNSISAESTDIHIMCDLARADPVLVVADNGHGMAKAEIIAAMRHGAVNPKKPRAPKDLGRFGLGLKTASFSQCKRLTVVSCKEGAISSAEWNMQEIEESDCWNISVLEPQEINESPFIDLLGDHGTLVIWRQLDRLFEEEAGQKRDEIVNEKLSLVEHHLSLVFHRFLSGDVKGSKKVSIGINGHKITPFDPFCRKNPATQMLPEEIVWVNDVAISMQPYILPHHSRLSVTDYDFYQSRSDFISNQGAYVYRNGRLMAWGDWFRLIPKGESTKLARVQIDFPNSLDEAWTIDIKKSRARPPHAVRERLRQIISKVSNRSVTVHRGRGQKLFQEVEAPIWDRYVERDGIRFLINKEHPLVASLASRISSKDADALYVLLESIAASLPVEMIYSDYSISPRDMSQSSVVESEIMAKLKSLKQVLYGDSPVDADAFLHIVLSTRLFEGQIEVVEKYIRDSLA